MVTHPVIGSISNMLFNFNSSSQGYIERFPQLEVPVAPLIYKTIVGMHSMPHAVSPFSCQTLWFYLHDSWSSPAS